jgi:hypothetical protein
MPKKVASEGRVSGDLLAALSQPTKKHPGTPCGVTKILNTVEPEVRDKIVEIIAEMRHARDEGRTTVYTGSWLAETLRNAGFTISALTVTKHISKRCRCD